MTKEKYKSEIETLNSFFITFCHAKHQDQKKYLLTQNFQKIPFHLQGELCEECRAFLEKITLQLSFCPQENKPRCRKCKNSCYEKEDKKRLAKIMRYSGMKLGLLNLKKAIFR